VYISVANTDINKSLSRRDRLWYGANFNSMKGYIILCMSPLSNGYVGRNASA